LEGGVVGGVYYDAVLFEGVCDAAAGQMDGEVVVGEAGAQRVEVARQAGRGGRGEHESSVEGGVCEEGDQELGARGVLAVIKRVGG
jgi:hypothetical protein